MQSLAAQAYRILAWEQIDLSNGVYRVQEVRWVTEVPDITAWAHGFDNEQWSDEVDTALKMAGVEREGIYIGVFQAISGICHGLAWSVP